jgi:hypothetical protein
MTNPIDAQAASSEAFIGSKQKPKNGYGQNGFGGPSSDLPGHHTTSGFLPQTKLPDEASDGQTRAVSTLGKHPGTDIPTHPGMKSPAAPTKIGGGNIRRPTERVMGGHFQR